MLTQNDALTFAIKKLDLFSRSLGILRGCLSGGLGMAQRHPFVITQKRVGIRRQLEHDFESIAGGVPEDAPPHVFHPSTKAQAQIHGCGAIDIQDQQVLLDRFNAVQADALDDSTHPGNRLRSPGVVVPSRHRPAMSGVDRRFICGACSDWQQRQPF